MRIGIFGAGAMGEGLAAHLRALGHEVEVSRTRDPAQQRALVERSEAVLLAVPYLARTSIVEAAGESWDGRIVVDLTNYYEARDGAQLDPGAASSSAQLAEGVPGAHVVKAFNTIWSRHLAEQADPAAPLDQRRAIPIAADDAPSKGVIATWIEAMGFAPVDAGTLADGVRQQPGTPVYNATLNPAEAREALAAAA